MTIQKSDGMRTYAQRSREEFTNESSSKTLAIMFQRETYDFVDRKERYVNGHPVVTVAGVYCQFD